jgi:hypothetical protein
VPTQLSNTFRLDLLSLRGARAAAVNLAEQGGRSFPPRISWCGIGKQDGTRTTFNLRYEDYMWLDDKSPMSAARATTTDSGQWVVDGLSDSW